MKNKQIVIRLSESEHKKVMSLIEQSGLNQSDYIRQKILNQNEVSKLVQIQEIRIVGLYFKKFLENFKLNFESNQKIEELNRQLSALIKIIRKMGEEEP